MKKRNIQNFEKALSFSVMTPKKKGKKVEKFRNRNRLGLKWREKGKREKENKSSLY